MHALYPGKFLYSVGDCPVCSVSGAILVLISVSTGAPVFYCPACETAWERQPEPHRLDEVHSLQELVPAGVRLPSKEEIARLLPGRVTAVDYEDWAGQLVGLLRPK